MDGFGEEEIWSDETYSCKSSLQIEDYTPGFKCDDYASDEGTKCRTDEGTAKKPSHCGTTFCWAVDVSYAGCTDSKKAMWGLEFVG